MARIQLKPGEKKWLIGKELRRCTSSACRGVDEFKAKITITPDGMMTITCKYCEDSYTRQCTEYWTLKACKNTSCGHVRRVTVKMWKQHNKETGKFDTWVENWADYCYACELEHSARKHTRLASEFQVRAQKIRRARLKTKSVAA